AGFNFVRLAVDPAILLRPDGEPDPQRIALVLDAVSRLESHGLGVVVGLHPSNWRLEQSARDRESLAALWRLLASAMRGLDPRLTFPEILNEPVFRQDPLAWEALQASVLAEIRARLPGSTVVLSGNQWGSLDGL